MDLQQSKERHPERVELPPSLVAWLGKPKAHFIDGAWVSTAETFPTLNPATEEKLSEVCVAGASEVDRAVLAARASFEAGTWAGTPMAERAKVLHAIADRIDTHSTTLAVLESLDTGKPIRESLEGDIPRAAQNFRFFADYAEDTPERFDQEQAIHWARREPLGVVALITPWNLPLYLETWKLAPALLMGNSVCLKPSELTPLTASYLAELLEGLLPSGVFNLLHGFGAAAAGEFLTSHPQVDAISFTGETETGRAIMKSASQGPTRVSFELGGKGAFVVFEDADVETVIPEALRAAYRNQGEICLACPRIYVHQDLYDRFKTRFVAEAERIQVGDPLRYATQMGALISGEHLEKVNSFVARVRPPLRIETGGTRPKGLAKGYYLAPTVITGADRHHAITQQEIFGPVASLYSFTSEEQVAAEVNATPYGLSASVWTQDEARIARLSRTIRTGLLWFNCWFVRDLRVPFGGQKRSGIGREGGRHSLDFYSEVKSICIKRG